MRRFDQEFSDIASTVQKMQRDIILTANSPEKVKVLRRFSSQEAAQMLGLTSTEWKKWRSRPEFPKGISKSDRFTYSMDDVLTAHALLNAHTDASKRSRPVRPEGTSMAVVTVSNFKGGSAKTTQATLFAQHAARAGYRVIIIDLDVQGSTTSIFGIDPSDVDTMTPDGKARVPDSLRSIGSWVIDRKSEGIGPAASAAIVQTYWPNIAIVPASAALHDVEGIIQSRATGSDPNAPDDGVRFYDEVGSFLRLLDGHFDIAVIDCRPDVNMLTTNAIHAATGLIIPVRADMLDVQSFGEFAKFLSGLDTAHRELFDPAGLNNSFVKILPTIYRPTATAQASVIASLSLKHPNWMLGAEMLDSSAITTAGVERRTIYEWAPPANARPGLNRALASADRVNRAIEMEIRRFWGVLETPVSLPIEDVSRKNVQAPPAHRSANLSHSKPQVALEAAE